MSRVLAVLRPEPGNAATAARITALGRATIRLPLFEAHALDWIAPDPENFDALLLTSANAVRLGGTLPQLPVFAVGEATAAAARAAGLDVVHTGTGDAATLIAEAEARGIRHAVSLAGRDRTIERGGIVAEVIAVYVMEPVPVDPRRLGGSVALLHSARAARRLAELVEPATVRIATISAAVADAAGPGWEQVAIATFPDDPALIAAAIALAD